jgi:hypothetical protein
MPAINTALAIGLEEPVGGPSRMSLSPRQMPIDRGQTVREHGRAAIRRTAHDDLFAFEVV